MHIEGLASSESSTMLDGNLRLDCPREGETETRPASTTKNIGAEASPPAIRRVGAKQLQARAAKQVRVASGICGAE